MPFMGNILSGSMGSILHANLGNPSLLLQRPFGSANQLQLGVGKHLGDSKLQERAANVALKEVTS
jgi:hypothetical protein